MDTLPHEIIAHTLEYLSLDEKKCCLLVGKLLKDVFWRSVPDLDLILKTHRGATVRHHPDHNRYVTKLSGTTLSLWHYPVSQLENLTSLTITKSGLNVDIPRALQAIKAAQHLPRLTALHIAIKVRSVVPLIAPINRLTQLRQLSFPRLDENFYGSDEYDEDEERVQRETKFLLPNVEKLTIYEAGTFSSTLRDQFPKLRLLRSAFTLGALSTIFEGGSRWSPHYDVSCINATDPDKDNYTPLLAASEHSISLAVSMLEHARQHKFYLALDVTNTHGFTPLLLACKNPDGLELARGLIEIGADPFYISPVSQDNALSLAAESGNPEIYNFIWQQVAHAPRNPVAAVPIVRSTLAEDYTIEFLLERDPSIIYHRDPIGSRLPIHAAAAKGHNQVLRWILARAPQQARATDINGRTPLHEVALRGNQEAFSLLLQHGARLSAVDMFGNTVLSEALSGHVDDRWEMVDQIIDNEDVDIFLGNPVTTMKQAIKGGFLEVVKRLAAKPDISIGEHANELVTAISKVLDTYPGEAIQILETVLATKPKFSETTPILVSVLKSSTLDDKSALSVVQPLLAAGANPNLASLDNKTALSVAVDGSWPSVVDALLKAGATVDNEAHSKSNRSLLHQACASESFAIARVLLANGADPNAVDDNDNTPVMRVLLNRNTVKESIRTSMLKLLLDNGADIHGGRIPPIIAATMAQCPKSMELILKRGANINALGPDNVTPLSQALLQKTFNLMPVLDLILKHNPNPNIVPTNPKFYPALHTAAKNYADGTVLKKVLAIPGIDLDIRTIDTKRTALHHLICLFASNDTFMHQNAEILLESGLSLNSRDQLGDNCLMSHLRSVQFYPNNNVVKFCLNRGIDLHATNNENQSVPDIIRNRSGELTTYYHYLIVYWDKSAKKIRKAMDKQRQQQRQR